MNNLNEYCRDGCHMLLYSYSLFIIRHGSGGGVGTIISALHSLAHRDTHTLPPYFLSRRDK